MVFSLSLLGGTQLNSPILQGGAGKPARFALVFFSHPCSKIFLFMCCWLFFQHEAKLLTCNTERLKPKDVFVNFCATQSFAYISKVAAQFCKIIRASISCKKRLWLTLDPAAARELVYSFYPFCLTKQQWQQRQRQALQQMKKSTANT